MRKLTKKFNKWAVSSKALSFPRRVVGKAINNAISSKNGVIIFYNNPEQSKVFDLIRPIKKESEMLLEDNEAYQVYMVAKRTQKIEGAIAEVGVYKGGSAKLICEVKGNKELHLFDTFEGLPELCEKDGYNQYTQGQYAASFEAVKNYLSKYPEVYFYKGCFPDTADPIKNKNFSFVNLDVDIYESTLNGLKFFYPRMTRGGIILSHDYSYSTGVKTAFEEFFKDKPETIIELSGTHCLVVKL